MKFSKLLTMKKLLVFIGVFFTVHISVAQLSGTYTIGLGLTDYATIQDAVNDLATNGINGCVIFNILDGEYNEQITIPAISGVSATDTIIFQSQSADTSKVRIYYGASDDTDNWIVKLDGCSYITFKNLTFQAVGGNTDKGNVFVSGSEIHNINLFNNHIIGKGQNADPYDAKTLLYFDDANSSNIRICGNYFENSKYYTRTGSNFEYNFVVKDNYFVGNDFSSAYFPRIEGFLFKNNYVQGSLNCYYGQGDYDVVNNFVTLNIEVNYYNYYSDPGKTAFVYNNTTYRLSTRSSKRVKIFHNTCTNMLKVYANCDDIYIANNIVQKGDSYEGAITILDSSDVAYLDYNVVYSTGTLYYLEDENGATQTFTTLEDWQNATNFSEHSINQQVFFDGEAPKLYECMEPLIGVDLGIPEDYEGDTRTYPIIGADEYVPQDFDVFVSDDEVNGSTEVIFTVSYNNGDITWFDPAGTQISDVDSFAYTPTIEGYYKAVLLNDACLDSDSVYISINTGGPTFDLNDTTIYLDINGQAVLSPEMIISNVNSDNDIVDTIISKTEFNCSDLGDNNITVTITDNFSNSTTKSCIVTVADTIMPTIECVDNQVVSANSSHVYTVQGNEFDPTVNDNCLFTLSNDFNGQSTLADAELTEGEHTITWTVVDSAGNTQHCIFTVTVNAYTGIAEDTDSFTIYPNPATNFLNIETEVAEYTVYIYDVLGKLIWTKTINSKQTEIDLSDFNSGVYTLKVVTKTQVLTNHFVKN